METIGKRIKKVLAWIKSNGLILIILFICFISVFMVYQYRKNFSGGMSTVSSDWGNFGSYLGAITGLLGFAGAIYAIMNSNKQARNAEERSVFFKMFDLYQKKVDAVSYEGEKGIQAFKKLGEKANNLLCLYVTIDSFRDPDFEQNKKKYNELLSKKSKTIYRTLEMSMDKIEIELYTLFNIGVHKKNDDEFKKIIGLESMLNIEKFYKESLISEAHTYYEIIAQIMDVKEHYAEYKKTILQIMKNNKEEIFLIQYYNSVCSLLRMINLYDNKRVYLDIFISQLSRYELLMLLYYATCKQSAKDIASLYMDNNLLDNIELNDLIACHIMDIDLVILDYDYIKYVNFQESKKKDFVNGFLLESQKDHLNKE
jgi:hypothetical protein